MNDTRYSHALPLGYADGAPALPIPRWQKWPARPKSGDSQQRGPYFPGPDPARGSVSGFLDAKISRVFLLSRI